MLPTLVCLVFIHDEQSMQHTGNDEQAAQQEVHYCLKPLATHQNRQRREQNRNKIHASPAFKQPADTIAVSGIG